MSAGMHFRAMLLWGMALLLFAGCAHEPGGSERQVSNWANARGFQSAWLNTPLCPLFSALRPSTGTPSTLLTVYIEGDGAPWPNPYTPPENPTPKEAVSLSLADVDHSGAVAYLARPGQYLAAPSAAGCPEQYWTSARFAPELINAMDQALTQLKAQAHAQQLRLVGFSGGGVMAALLAEQRPDVVQYITLAAPLALTYWTELHQVSPLKDSIDPITRPIPPGLHWVGLDDEIVPPQVLETFIAKRGGQLRPVIDADHDCCWRTLWSEFVRSGFK